MHAVERKIRRSCHCGTRHLGWQCETSTEMDVNCCLCRKTLTSEIKKKTRKRIHCASCREVKARLESISSVSLDNVLEISDPNAHLCRSCYSEISSIDSLEAKLAVQKSAVEENCLSYTVLLLVHSYSCYANDHNLNQWYRSIFACLNVLKEQTLFSRHHMTKITSLQLGSLHYQLLEDKLKTHHQMCR